jgi:hypothetical protein
MIMPSSPDASRRSIGLGRATEAAIAPCALTVSASPVHAKSDACRAGASALSDAKAIAGVRGAIARSCPAPRSTRRRREEAQQVREVRQDGDHRRHRRTPSCAPSRPQGVQERGEEIYSQAACGYPGGRCAGDVLRGEARAAPRRRRRRCRSVDAPNGKVLWHACYASPFGSRRLQLRRHQLVRRAGRAGDGERPERRAARRTRRARRASR